VATGSTAQAETFSSLSSISPSHHHPSHHHGHLFCETIHLFVKQKKTGKSSVSSQQLRSCHSFDAFVFEDEENLFWEISGLMG
jgi:hypothetical protein